jgi:hypothetical protein
MPNGNGDTLGVIDLDQTADNNRVVRELVRSYPGQPQVRKRCQIYLLKINLTPFMPFI